MARAAVGIGEAAYATLAPAVLADFFPPERRNRVFTVFYVATPVGSAIGFVLGGVLGEHFGWRTAFLAVGPARAAGRRAGPVDEGPGARRLRREAARSRCRGPSRSARWRRTGSSC